MLTTNQIERLIMHTKQQIDSLDKHNLQDVDPDAYWYRKGFIAALKLVLSGDETTINNKPINKETSNAPSQNVD